MTQLPNTEILEHTRIKILSAYLEPVYKRLIMVDGWQPNDAKQLLVQYRNYLFLKFKYPEYNLPPSNEIDEAWHAHILHTSDYRQFCEEIFFNEKDCYLDHNPHLEESKSLDELNSLFEKTQELYLKEFGTYIYQIRSWKFGKGLLEKLCHIVTKIFPKLASRIDRTYP